MYHPPPNHPGMAPGSHLPNQAHINHPISAQQQPPQPPMTNHERQVQEQLRKTRLHQSQQFHIQENNDPLIKFSRDIKKMKILLEELMTLSCEALTENTKVDNSKSNETSTASQKPENSDEQSSFENE